MCPEGSALRSMLSHEHDRVPGTLIQCHRLRAPGHGLMQREPVNGAPRKTRAHVHTALVVQAQLFDAPPAGPPGFAYAPQFLSVAQEAQLLEVIRTLPFEEAQYK